MAVMSKYIQLYEGDSMEFSPKENIASFICCDCGLAHTFKFKFRRKNRNVIMTIFGDDKLTVLARRRRRRRRR